MTNDVNVADEVPATKQPWGSDALGAIGTNLLGAYLLVLPCAVLYGLWALFSRTLGTPAATLTEPDFLLLAVLGGALGSYMHVAQSFAAYVGNRQACASWVWWYLLRTPIGACLGVLMYIVIRAGLLGSTSNPPIYGVLAFSALAGWFSKQATDKLAEVFDLLFRAEKKEQLKDKLKAAPKPQIELLVPKTEAGVTTLVIRGTGFEQGAHARMDDRMLKTTFVNANELKADLPAGLTPGTRSIAVINPPPGSLGSEKIEWTLEA